MQQKQCMESAIKRRLKTWSIECQLVFLVLLYGSEVWVSNILITNNFVKLRFIGSIQHIDVIAYKEQNDTLFLLQFLIVVEIRRKTMFFFFIVQVTLCFAQIMMYLSSTAWNIVKISWELLVHNAAKMGVQGY